MRLQRPAYLHEGEDGPTGFTIEELAAVHRENWGAEITDLAASLHERS